jgi:hypothetical protein
MKATVELHEVADEASVCVILKWKSMWLRVRGEAWHYGDCDAEYVNNFWSSTSQ